MLIVRSFPVDLGSCSGVPQNLTSGRRSTQLQRKSLMLEATAREDGTNLYERHLSAGMLYGPPTKHREGADRL